jgi:hypothetical protein
MRRSLRALSVVFSTAAVALGAFTAGVPLASAADCQDAPVVAPVVVNCSCGDRVVGTKHLSGADPVTSTKCPADGLIIGASGVVLDMNGRIITGSGVGAGVKFEAGLSGVKVRGGEVRGFAVGIETQASSGAVFGSDASDNDTLRIKGNGTAGLKINGAGSIVRRVLLQNNGAAADVTGNSNRLERVVVRDNASGVAVNGDVNTLLLNIIERTTGVSVKASGVGNTLERNTIRLGGGDGLQVDGSDAHVIQNQIKQVGGNGVDIGGAAHFVTRNVISTAGGDGITGDATGSTFTRNQVKSVPGFGIEDTSVGTGTGGTANSYSLNTCSAATAGKSSPAGLCR